MTKYVLAFHGGTSPASPEEAQELVAKWARWMEGLGPALQDPGAPANSSKTVHADGSVTEGGGVNPVTGYTMIEADSYDHAVTLVGGCPIFDADGSIEILEMP